MNAIVIVAKSGGNRRKGSGKNGVKTDNSLKNSKMSAGAKKEK